MGGEEYLGYQICKENGIKSMIGPKSTLVLSRYTDAADGMGSFTRTWSDLRNIKGVFWTLSGNEMLAYSKITEEISHKFAFNVLKSVTITCKDRLRLGIRLFDIKFIDQNSDRGDWTILLLKEYNT